MWTGRQGGERDGARAPGSAERPLPRAPAGPARPRPPPIAGARRLRAEARHGVGARASALLRRGVARSPEGVCGRRVAGPGPTRGSPAARGAGSQSGRPVCRHCPRGRAAAAAAPAARRTGVAAPTATAEGRLPESGAWALQGISGLQTMPWSIGMLHLVSASC